jgi:E3 ubiquitin-protein ligase UBR4
MLKVTKIVRDATVIVNKYLQSRVEYTLQHFKTLDVGSFVGSEMQLIADIMHVDDTLWETRLRLILGLFFSTIEQGANNSVLCEHVLLPCLNIVADLVKLSNKPGYSVGPTALYDEWKHEQSSFQDWKRRYEGVIFPESTEKLEARHLSLASKYAAKWKEYTQRKTKQSMQIDTLIEPGWLNKLITAPSQAVRTTTVALLNSLCNSGEPVLFFFLELATRELLPEILAYGENSAEFFSLFRKLIEPTEHKLYLTVKGFLPQLCQLISKEISTIQALEGGFTVTDLSQGYALKTLVDILSSFLDIPTIKQKFKRSKLVEHLLDGFLYLRGLILQKNKLIDDSCKQLSSLLDKMHAETDEDNKSFIVACSEALTKHVGLQTPLFILEQLCNIICPVKPDPVYQLILKKSSTQEDFIRGSMTNNPYSTLDIGPLMRDVKNKICTTLDLHALLEDDNSMELLVANKIIKLDLSIKQVVEQVWNRSLQSQGISDSHVPMVVVYRLQGLDGEATEEMVDSLQDDSEEQRDPEEVYKISEAMSDCGGLVSVMRLISSSNFDTDKELIQVALKLLYYCAKIKRNRQTLLSIGAVNALLPKLKLAFAESHTDLSELLLLTIESLVHQANTSKELDYGTNVPQNNTEEAIQQMKMLLDKLPLLKGKLNIVKTVSRYQDSMKY